MEDAQQVNVFKKLKSDRSIRSFASGRNSVDVILKKDLPDKQDATLKEEIRKKKGKAKSQKPGAEKVESKGSRSIEGCN